MGKPIESRSIATATPRTVVLAVWPWAPTHMIQSYVEDYHNLFPYADIQVLHPSVTAGKPSILGKAKDNWQLLSHRQALPPAADLGSIFLHVFGDDAADEVCQWLRAYQLQQLVLLDVRWSVMDCVPAFTSTIYHTMARRVSMSGSIETIRSTTASWIKDQTSQIPWPRKPITRSVTSGPTCSVRDLHRVDGLLPDGVIRCYVVDHKDSMFFWRQRQEGLDGDDEGVCGMEERFQERITRSAVDASAWNTDRERYWSLIGQMCSV